ncbi:MAG: F0F1 ATP synthase subunit A [Acidobacteria bacterium]|nr:F0F1 ATP synthase subunit A [Acidobacteriota bacterium]
MEKLEHPLWIVQLVNALLGPLVHRVGEALGYHFTGHEVIPPYMVMVLLIVVFVTALCLFMRARLSVEDPGKLQVLIEDGVRAVMGLLDEWIGPKGHQFLPLIATLGLFILLSNYMGLIPGLMSPTSSISVHLHAAVDHLPSGCGCRRPPRGRTRA